MSRARVEGPGGKRKLSDEHRRKLSDAAKRQAAAETPEQRAARLERIGRKPKPDTGPPAPAAGTDPPERRNPLAMTPLELVRSLRGRRG